MDDLFYEVMCQGMVHLFNGDIEPADAGRPDGADTPDHWNVCVIGYHDARDRPNEVMVDEDFLTEQEAVDRANELAQEFKTGQLFTTTEDWS